MDDEGFYVIWWTLWGEGHLNYVETRVDPFVLSSLENF